MSLSREQFNDIKLQLKSATSDKDIVALALALHKIADQYDDFNDDANDLTPAELTLMRPSLFGFIKDQIDRIEKDGAFNDNPKTKNLLLIFSPMLESIRATFQQDEFLDEARLFAPIDALLNVQADDTAWSESTFHDVSASEINSVETSDVESDSAYSSLEADEISFQKMDKLTKSLKTISETIAVLKQTFDSLKFTAISDELRDMKEDIISEVNVIQTHYASVLSNTDQAMNRLTMENKSLAVEFERQGGLLANITAAIKTNKLEWIQFQAILDQYNKIIDQKDKKKIGKDLDEHVPLAVIYEVTGESQKAVTWDKADKPKVVKAMQKKKAELIKTHKELAEKNTTVSQKISSIHAKGNKNKKEFMQLQKHYKKLKSEQKAFKKNIKKLKQDYLDAEADIKVLHRAHFIVPAIQKYKDNFNNYLKQSHKDFLFRDAMGTLFGKNQRKKRKAYFDTVLEPALDQYDPEGDNRPLVDALAQGATFRSRVGDASPQYDKTMQHQLDEIERILIKRQ